MTKPAILHIITRLDLGGAQRSCLALIAELQQNYPDFEIYLISGTTGELVAQAKALKNVILLDTLVWEVKPANLVLECRNFVKLIQLMRNLKAKHPQLIIHTHTIKAGTLGRWAAFLAGIKIRLHTIHGFSFHPYQNKLVWLVFYLVELFNSLITTHFICVSSQDLKAGREIFPQFAQKSSLIRAATLYDRNTTSWVERSNQPKIEIPPRLTIGTIASLKPGKNLFELLKIFRFAQNQLQNHHIALQLEIVGDGPLRPYLAAYLAQNKLAASVKIIGWTPCPLIYAKNWHGFLFTSLWEGLPCALVEIKDSHIPIFAYQVGGLADLIDQNNLTPPGKWLDLSKQLIQAQLNPVSQLPGPTKPDFYITIMAADHIKLYKGLLASLPPF